MGTNRSAVDSSLMARSLPVMRAVQQDLAGVVL
jgi:hypothetical protein